MKGEFLRQLRQRSVIGHRGNQAALPENTLRGLLDAVQLGVDAVEFDVRLTGDGVVVLMHDETLDRTTDGTGRLLDASWSTVSALDAAWHYTHDNGATFPCRSTQIGVPRLSDVLEALPGTPMIIEIKEVAAVDAVRREILRHGAERHVVVGSFHEAALPPFDDTAIPRLASSRETLALYPAALAGRIRVDLPFQAMSLPPRHKGIPVPLGALARCVAPAHMPVFAWTINAPRQAVRLWQQGVRGVLSDDPEAVMRARDADARVQRSR